MKIAISGKMGSGKNFLAQKIIDQFEYTQQPFKTLAFGDSLKEMMYDFFNIKKGEHPYAREILQQLGAVGRLADPLYWVTPVIEEAKASYENVIVTDLRYINEAEALKENGFILIRVDTFEEVRANRTTLTSQTDSSEIDLDDYQFDAIFDGNTDYKTNKLKYDGDLKQLMEHLVSFESHKSLVMK